MKVQKINSNPQSFQGIYLGKSKNYINNIETGIDLFEITIKDKAFLEKLKNTVKMEKLFPSKQIQEYKYDRWQEMLSGAVDAAYNRNRKCILAAKDNKPCGIMTFEQGEKRFHLDCVCTWPVEAGHKVPLAGQTLFQQMFGFFLESKANLLDLTAILNGPFDTVCKYMRLGFKQTGGENNLVAMRITRSGAEDTMKKLDNVIFTTKSKNSTEVDLAKELKL